MGSRFQSLFAVIQMPLEGIRQPAGSKREAERGPVADLLAGKDGNKEAVGPS